MSVVFKDDWLEDFYENSIGHRLIARNIENALFRKIQILDAAKAESDLIVPSGNRFEHLSGKLKQWCSIRVNKQYRMVFRWIDGVAVDTYLDAHTYRGK